MKKGVVSRDWSTEKKLELIGFSTAHSTNPLLEQTVNKYSQDELEEITSTNHDFSQLSTSTTASPKERSNEYSVGKHKITNMGESAVECSISCQCNAPHHHSFVHQ